MYLLQINNERQINFLKDIITNQSVSQKFQFALLVVPTFQAILNRLTLKLKSVCDVRQAYHINIFL